jgi:soluble lytic murein transglycosylase-like protein
MQLMPDTARELGVEPTDPGQNVDGGTRYLSGLLERYAGRLDLALAAYNAGPASVDRAGGRVPEYRETQDYVERVLGLYRRLGRSEFGWHGSGDGADLEAVNSQPAPAEEP